MCESRLHVLGEVEANPYMLDAHEMTHWRCRLSRGPRSMTLVFSKGPAHEGRPPTLEEVFECLESDAESVNGQTFAQWCAALGYDQDSRTALRTYKAIVDQARKFRRVVRP